jgi:hypothetical protein
MTDGAVELVPAMATARMPRFAYSSATHRVKCFTAVMDVG